MLLQFQKQIPCFALGVGFDTFLNFLLSKCSCCSCGNTAAAGFLTQRAIFDFAFGQKDSSFMAFGSSFHIFMHLGRSEFLGGPFFLVICRMCADLVLGLFSDKWACFCSNSTSFSFSFQVLLASTILVRLSTEGTPSFLLKYRAKMILAQA